VDHVDEAYDPGFLDVLGEQIEQTCLSDLPVELPEPLYVETSSGIGQLFSVITPG